MLGFVIEQCVFFWNVVLEKTLENPLDCNEIKSVNPKWNQSWIFIERADAEAEAPIFCPPAVKSQLIRKDSDAGDALIAQLEKNSPAMQGTLVQFVGQEDLLEKG